MKVFFFVVLICISLHSFQSFQSRYVGVVKDIKYVAKGNDGKYIFWTRTDSGREFFFKASEVPYFSIGDSLLEYWVDLQSAGVGTNKSVYYYPNNPK